MLQIAAAFFAFATVCGAQPFDDIAGSAFSPLNRPYTSAFSDFGGTAGSPPYVTMNSLSGQNGGYYGSGGYAGGQYENGLAGGFGRAGRYGSFGSPYAASAINGPYGGAIGNPLPQYGSNGAQYSGSSGGCCMPASTANALASQGIGSIYYGSNALSFATDSDPTTTAATGLPQQPQNGFLPSSAPFGNQYGTQFPASSVGGYGNNGYSGVGSTGAYGGPHLCFPICGGGSNGAIGAGSPPIYGSYGSNGLLNAYGSNASPFGYPGLGAGFGGFGDTAGFGGLPTQSTFSGVNTWPYNSGNDFSNSLFGNSAIGFPRRSSSSGSQTTDKKPAEKGATKKA